MKKGYIMIILLVIHLLCSVTGLTLVKMGANTTSFGSTNGLMDIKVHYLTIVGLSLYIISFIMWMVLLNYFDLSYISPIIMGLSQVLIIISAVLILGEKVSTMQAIGIATIIAGVVMINIKR